MSIDHIHCVKCQRVIDLTQANADYQALNSQIAALPPQDPLIVNIQQRLKTLQSRIAQRLCEYCYNETYTVRPMDPTGTYVP